MLVGMGIVNPDSERGGSTRVNNEPGGQIYHEGGSALSAVASQSQSVPFPYEMEECRDLEVSY